MDLIALFFGLTTALTLYLFFKAAAFNKTVLLVVSLWLALQAVLTLNGFYQLTGGNPPRFALLLLPPVLFILGSLFNRRGRLFLDDLDKGTLTLLHVVRLPVELVLYALFLKHRVPAAMTFEGHNLDILSGLTAPLIWYLGYRRKLFSRRVLLTWNLVLLANVVSKALTRGLVFPAFALRDFPFSWLPSVVVPLVLLAQLGTIRQLIRKGEPDQ